MAERELTVRESRRRRIETARLIEDLAMSRLRAIKTEELRVSDATKLVTLGFAFPAFFELLDEMQAHATGMSPSDRRAVGVTK